MKPVAINSSDQKWRKGAFILGVTGAVVGGLYAVATPFVLPAFRRICLPYVPATTTQVENVFSALARSSSPRMTTNSVCHERRLFVDLGSGDGRIVIEAAKRGYTSVGYELNPWLVWYSRFAARRAGVHRETSFYRKNLWNVDLQQFDVILIFGVSQMMEPLEAKISSEMKSSTTVVACRFPIPGWDPRITVGEGVDEVWLYRASEKLKATRTNQTIDNDVPGS